MALQASSAGGFSVESFAKLQMSDGPNPVSAPINSALLVWLPDPDSATVGSEFITAAGTTWRIEISVIQGSLPGSVIFTSDEPIANNARWIALDPAVFNTSATYRVRISDGNGNIADEWDFRLFNINATPTGPANLAEINNRIRRIAGLLGYRQRVSYSNFVLGKPLEATIDLLDNAGVVIAQYRRKVVTDAPMGS